MPGAADSEEFFRKRCQRGRVAVLADIHSARACPAKASTSASLRRSENRDRAKASARMAEFIRKNQRRVA